MVRSFLAASVLLLAAALVGTGFSDATWNSSSSTTLAVAAANDWTPPTVVMVDPGATVGGVTTISASAADARSSIVSVLIEVDAPGNPVAFTPVCTDTTAPFSCDWDTTAVVDGSPYRLRATATDDAGYTSASATVSTRVMNYSVTLAAIAPAVRGTVPLSATWHGSGTESVSFQRSANGTSSWQTLTGCGNRTAAPTATCSWDSTTLDSQQWYFRATLSYAGITYSDTQAAGVVVDNVPPTVTLTVPPGTLYGTVVLTATADDTDPDAGDASSGVASVAFEYRRTGTTPWTTCGVDTGAPYSCSLATGTLPDGTYDLRATATDGAGGSTSTAVQSATINNSNPWAKVTAPATGTTIAQGADITVTADAYSGSGVAGVQLQYDPVGTTSWTTICTDTTAAYSCTWDTAGVPAGATALRAVMTPRSGGQVISSSVTVTIQQLQAVDVDGRPAEGGTPQVKPGEGDVLTFTYSAVVRPTTIRAGWNGASILVGVTMRDKNVTTGQAVASSDWLELTDTSLGQVAFSQNYVDPGASVVFTGSTMTATTETVGGVQRTVVTVTLGEPDPLTVGKLNSVGAGTMTWTPSTSVLSVDGSSCTGGAAVEKTGSPADRDL